jgi:hypothetical protein
VTILNSAPKPALSILSDSFREAWQRNGYIHLTGVLDERLLRRMRRGVEDTVEKFEALPDTQRLSHLGATGTTASDDMRLRNVVSLSSFMDELLDLPGVFELALALLGPYMQVCGTEILLRRPYPKEALALHVDGGSSLGRMLPNVESNVSHVKALYFLTDVEGADQGNVVLVPGSHVVEFPSSSQALAAHPFRKKAFQVSARAGDVILFPATLWHAVAPNKGDVTRTSLVVWYSQLWARPVDYFTIDPRVLERLTARQRLLLGGLPGAKPVTFYLPMEPDYLPNMTAGIPRSSSELLPFFQDYDEHRMDEETGR